MNFTSHGIPILTMPAKLEALSYCMANEAYEDAAGHLCDLLEHCRRNIHPTSGPQFGTLVEMVEKYGAHPAPIEP